METGRSLVPWVALGVVSVALAVSGVHPHDRLTWLLEVAPVVIGIPLLLATGRTFPLSHLLYALLAIHALILIYG
ncbi:MAG TPA: hypothetical protein PKC15_17000, partial [Rhodocyclaceae bacterium]|nr:hypothetical protein [Rhodocyclaceae bacterium]